MIFFRVLLAMLIAVPSASAGTKQDAAERAYQAARRHYYALKDDAARRKMRHHWLNAAHGFENVAEKYPKSDRAPDALYTAAELLNELSRISRVDEDLAAAIKHYRRVCDDYPKSSLMDDAALALARIYSDRIGDLEQARKVLDAAAEHGRGDRAREMEALARSVAPNAGALHFGPRKKAAPVVVAKKPAPSKVAADRVVARTTQERAVAASTPVKDSAEAPRVAEAPKVTDSPASAAPAVPADAESAPAGAVAEVNAPAPVNQSALAQAFERAAQTPAPGLSSKSTEVTATAKQTPAPSSSAIPAEVGALRASAEPAERRAPPVSTRAAAAEGKEIARTLPALDRAGVTLAEQLGLKVRRVVIDPGHGGHDSGALGKKSLMEKDVALQVSKQVAERLRAEGLEVLLTREDDRFIRLEDRARFANEAKGDLFISIHCNSAPNKKLRGIETYTLNTSADRYSIRLAARENASSEKGISDLQFILADLATKANTEESSRLATRVQKSLVSNLSAKYSGIKDLGTKEALFYVLLGVRMPAILVETSFLSHPEEGKRLASKGYQADLARAISDGVLEFLEHRGRLAQVK